MFTTVSHFRDPWVAHLLRGRLEADGIPAIVVDEFYVGNSWDLSFALGGVRVQVPSDRRADAKDVEALCREGAYKDMLAGAFGDLDDLRCPYCGCAQYDKRRPYPRAALAILLSAFAGSVMPPYGWIYGCKACGAAYRRSFCPGVFAKAAGMTLFVALNLAVLGAMMTALVLLLGSKGMLALLVIALIAGARWLTNFLSSQEPDQSS